MGRKRYSPEQIISMLREAEVLQIQGSQGFRGFGFQVALAVTKAHSRHTKDYASSSSICSLRILLLPGDISINSMPVSNNSSV